MFYEEQVIDGVLHIRTTPRGQWHPVSALGLTAELLHARREIEELKAAKAELTKSLAELAGHFDANGHEQRCSLGRAQWLVQEHGP